MMGPKQTTVFTGVVYNIIRRAALRDVFLTRRKTNTKDTLVAIMP
jgi:hypothetical protein